MTDPEKCGQEITICEQLRDIAWEHLPTVARTARHRVEASYFTTERQHVIFSFDPDDEDTLGMEVIENLAGNDLGLVNESHALRKRCLLDSQTGEVLLYDEQYGIWENNAFAASPDTRMEGLLPEQRLVGMLFGLDDEHREERRLEAELLRFTPDKYHFLLSILDTI